MAKYRSRSSKNSISVGKPSVGLLIIAVVFVVVAFLFQYVIFPEDKQVPLANGNENITQYQTDNPIKLNEIMTSNSVAYADEDGNFPDWIEVINVGNEPINIHSYSLTDNLERPLVFTFPNVTLEPNQVAVVFASDTLNNDVTKPFHAPFKLSSSGETIYLRGADGTVIDAVQTPALGTNQVYARNNETREWEVSTQYTPFLPNTAENATKVLGSQTIDNSELYINEVIADNKTTIPDADGMLYDWIELYNSSAEPINLTGYGLSDDPTNPHKWRFPETTLNAGDYLVVYASGEIKETSPGKPMHINFKISAENETIALSNTRGQLLSKLIIDNLASDTSLYRSEDGSWKTTMQPTPGKPNTAKSQGEMEKELSARNPYGVFLVEALASNTVEDSNGNSYDWVELSNSSAQSIDISGFGLSDNLNRARKWQFPSGTKLAAGERLVVYLSGLNKVDKETKTYHTKYKLSTIGTEQLALCTPDGIIFDKLPIEAQFPNISYGRAVDKSGYFYFTTVTPGAPNDSKSYESRAQSVQFSIPGGQYTEAVTVSLSAEEGAQIRYTTDCSVPTSDSPLYEGPIAINDITIIRAKAYKSGSISSASTTASYLIGVSHTLPVVSLVTNDENLFSEKKGIMVKGPNATAEFPYGSSGQGANFWMDWEYLASVEFFDTTGKLELAQNIGISLNGQYSRAMAQKSIGLYARTAYGKDTFNYNPFDDLNFTDYKAYVLRGSGQDGKYTRFRDAMLTEMLTRGTSLLYQENEPVILYLNGKYWGHYNLRERINKYFIAQHEGYTNPDAIDLIKGNSRVLNGTIDEWNKLYNFVVENDLTNDSNYEHVKSLVDIDNLIEFISAECISGNTDTGNIKYYRERKEGAKWKWILFDLDWALMTDTDSIGRYLENRVGANGMKNIKNDLWAKLVKRSDIKHRYLMRMGEMMAKNFNITEMLSEIDKWQATLEPEMPQHFEKWGSEAGGPMSAWKDNINVVKNYIINRVQRLIEFSYKDFDLSYDELRTYFGNVEIRYNDNFIKFSELTNKQIDTFVRKGQGK